VFVNDIIPLGRDERMDREIWFHKYPFRVFPSHWKGWVFLGAFVAGAIAILLLASVVTRLWGLGAESIYYGVVLSSWVLMFNVVWYRHVPPRS